MDTTQESSAQSLNSVIESALRTAMADVLALEHFREDDNFFALGGNSLAMIEIIGHTQRTLSIQFDPDLVIDTFFGDGTLRALIDRIESLVVDSRATRIEHGT
jgi:acyl carrier protein